MSEKFLLYRDAPAPWKYIVEEEYEMFIPCLEEYTFDTDHFKVEEGNLIVFPTYAWDGPSGPTLDTFSVFKRFYTVFIPASLIHDIFYQCLREGLLPAAMRKDADRVLRELLVKGMNGFPGISKFRAACVYHALRMFGGVNAR